MKARDSLLRLRRFAAEEAARKVSDLEQMIREFQTIAVDLDRQIASEEDRTGVRDPAHFAYSTFAKAAAQRRENLQTSIADLEVKLEAARRECEEARSAAEQLQPADHRDGSRMRRKSERRTAALG